MFENFQDPVSKVLKEQGIQRPVNLFTPPSPDLGDFCFVTNQIAGGEDPEEIAKQLQPELSAIDGIADVSIFNAGNKKKKIIYLNFTIAEDEKVRLRSGRIGQILKTVLDDEYGQLDVNEGKSVIVEHTSANPISPIHVGNLRNSVHGDTFARILEASGYDVFIHYYVNDVGLQIGFVVVGYELATKQLNLKPPVKIDIWCGQIYAIMNCLYTIQKLKRAGLERGVEVADNYQISIEERDLLQQAIDEEISSFGDRLTQLSELEKPDRKEKAELRELKLQYNRLNDEKQDIAKYIITYNDLHSRFEDLFDQLHGAVAEIDLQLRVSKYLKAYEQNSDDRITALFREVVTWVLTAFEWTLGRYNIEFDQFDFESEVTWSGLPTEIINKLAKTDYASVDDQAVRFSYPSKAMKAFTKAAGLTKNDLAIKGQVPDLQLRRSDGTALYAAKDIAYSIKKFQDRQPEKVFNVISSEQSLPQFQLLLPLHQLGYTEYAANLHHYTYENVDLLGRVMSGRLAKYILADDYYDETIIRARMAKRVADAERNIGLPKTDAEWEEENEILRAVALASTRFPLIETVPNKRMELDLDRELDFRRNAGPFVQYAHARTNSLIDKVTEEKGWEIDEIDTTLLAEYEIMELFNHLENLHDQILLAIEEQDPSKIASWLFTLAQSFMKFYENFPVLKAEDEELGRARFAVVHAIRKGLSTGLKMLGIPPASRL